MNQKGAPVRDVLSPEPESGILRTVDSKGNLETLSSPEGENEAFLYFRRSICGENLCDSTATMTGKFHRTKRFRLQKIVLSLGRLNLQSLLEYFDRIFCFA